MYDFDLPQKLIIYVFWNFVFNPHAFSQSRSVLKNFKKVNFRLWDKKCGFPKLHFFRILANYGIYESSQSATWWKILIRQIMARINSNIQFFWRSWKNFVARIDFVFIELYIRNFCNFCKAKILIKILITLIAQLTWPLAVIQRFRKWYSEMFEILFYLIHCYNTMVSNRRINCEIKNLVLCCLTYNMLGMPISIFWRVLGKKLFFRCYLSSKLAPYSLFFANKAFFYEIHF